ncbi:conserved hypothetical protein [Streptomyces himastatinicus ATCC 53653]|uniref:Uncharacterized protein n=1 Tax=Streptomyces himastatinicus ATCC 53653 TaxID=457427 RepID=D9WIT9_9ACTN|nr:conserved hypothetical protein [Streptomyces himastatinicus ATCC 53653]
MLGILVEDRPQVSFTGDEESVGAFRAGCAYPTLQLSYGVAEPIEDDPLEMTFTQDFGPLAPGETLRFPVADDEDSRAYLLVVPRDARVVATDAHGRPALLVHETSRSVLATYPVHGYHPPERCPRRLPSKLKRALGTGSSGSVPGHEQPDQH